MRLNAIERLRLAIFGRAAVLYIGIGGGYAVCGVDLHQRNSSHQMPLYALLETDLSAIQWFARDLQLATGLRIHTDKSARGSR